VRTAQVDLPTLRPTLVRRDSSGLGVGRIYPVGEAHRDGAWMAELGHLRVLTPYPSLHSAVEAICAYADANPQIAL
jgi:hypothetical protein